VTENSRGLVTEMKVKPKVYPHYETAGNSDDERFTRNSHLLRLWRW